MAKSKQQLPKRSEVATSDCWDLSSLYADESQWERDLAKLQRSIARFSSYRGKLNESPSQLAACLDHDQRVDRLADRLGAYAALRASEDQGDDAAQRLKGRFRAVAVSAGEAASFIQPEILKIPSSTLKPWLKHPKLRPYRLMLQRILRTKKHTLSQKEEQLMAMQGQVAATASLTFRQLHDADMKFGTLRDERGKERELSHATFISFLHSPDRDVRKKAFHSYYDQIERLQNTLASTLAGSIHGDVFRARARRFPSALEASLFPDQVPISVYRNLIATVRAHLPSVHRYFELRRRLMGLKQIHFYDTYVPVVEAAKKKTTWDQAVSMILKALQPLGADYGERLAKGLRSGWCDRYPNAGKQSGAFSYGVYDANPYILMNYKEDVFDDIFTLAHEAGHSMHSHYSAKTQPYIYFSYRIFVAEVASTVNEQLLSHHLQQQATSRLERAYLINHDLDSIRATIVRQTMFAEFEERTHAAAEQGQPLTADSMRTIYRTLLEDYLGPKLVIDPQLSLECFRIPHFYNAFYVYKYATGLSAAIALAERILNGGTKELNDYLGFLKGGCSKDPLDLLRDAGVEMDKPAPIEAALRKFDALLDEFESLME